MRGFIACFLILVASLTAVHAASETPRPADPPMRVILVRGNAPWCGTHCPSWISAEGRITPQTSVDFRRVIRQLRGAKAPLFINSGGGQVRAAMIIGRLVRSKGLEVAVGKTIFTPCAATDKTCDEKAGQGLTGKPTTYHTYCASACVLILAGGVKRYVDNFAIVGVHQMTLDKPGAPNVPVAGKPNGGNSEGGPRGPVSRRPGVEAMLDQQYTLLQIYLYDMGIHEPIMALMRATPSTSIHWLSRDELLFTKLLTEPFGSEKLIDLEDPATKPVAQKPSQPEPSTAVQPVPQHVESAFATGAVRAGSYEGSPIGLGIAFSWNSVLDEVSVTLLPQVSGGPVPTSALDIAFKIGTRPNQRFGPDAFASSRLALKMQPSDFCQLSKDPTIHLSVGQHAMREITAETIDFSIDKFDNISTFLAKVCKSAKIAQGPH